jgi:hypothetical protein
MQARMEQFRKQMDKIPQDALAELGKVLTKKQKLNFNKMLGKPFDLTKLSGGGGGNRQRNGTPNNETTAKQVTEKSAPATSKSTGATRSTDSSAPKRKPIVRSNRRS